MIANIKRYAMRNIKLKPMAQQTAVEWLDRWFRDNPEATHEEGNKALEQAKQMEKEQRIKDYNAGYTDAQCNHVNDAQNYANEQEYLNQTYKKD